MSAYDELREERAEQIDAALLRGHQKREAQEALPAPLEGAALHTPIEIDADDDLAYSDDTCEAVLAILKTHADYRKVEIDSPAPASVGEVTLIEREEKEPEVGDEVRILARGFGKTQRMNEMRLEYGLPPLSLAPRASDADHTLWSPSSVPQREVDRRVSIAVRHLAAALDVPVEQLFGIEITPRALVADVAEMRTPTTKARKGDEVSTTRRGATWHYTTDTKFTPTKDA